MGYRLFCDSEGEVEEGYYWYQDWFKEKAKFPLSEEEVEMVVDLYHLDSEIIKYMK